MAGKGPPECLRASVGSELLPRPNVNHFWITNCFKLSSASLTLVAGSVKHDAINRSNSVQLKLLFLFKASPSFFPTLLKGKKPGGVEKNS